MIIILDTNVMVSALIKDSFTRRIIIYSGLKFCYPEISLHELRKHKNLILKKSGLSESEYEKIMSKLMEYIVLIPTEKIMGHIDEAKQIMQHIDPDDVVFIASTFSCQDSVIWSDDKHFEKQNKIKVLKTRDFVNLL